MSARRAWPAAAVAILLAAGLILALTSGSDEPAAAGGPNFVVVLTDDQDVASLRVMNRTRRLIADRGATFSNSYVTTPECCPSRASFLTGQYAHNHGVRASQPPEGGFVSLDGSETLAVWLAEAGYRTGYLGKYLNGYGNRRQGSDPAIVPPGWSDWAALIHGTEHQLYDYDLSEDGTVRSYGSAPDDYLSDVLREKALAFLDEAAGAQPFLLTIAPPVPHGEGPLEGRPGVERDPRPAERDLGRFENEPLPRPTELETGALDDKPEIVRERAGKTIPRLRSSELEAVFRGRLESLVSVDRLVGAVVERLAELGELDDTYVIFTSDNGFILGEHGLLGKDFPYEPSARVPLLIRGPGIPSGVVRRDLVANIDLAPTIAELAGVEPGLEADGISIARLARDGTRLDRRSLLIEMLEGKRYRALRFGDYMYARYENGDRELYDLRRDPEQLENLARGSLGPDALRSELNRLADCAGAACRPHSTRRQLITARPAR